MVSVWGLGFSKGPLGLVRVQGLGFSAWGWLRGLGFGLHSLRAAICVEAVRDADFTDTSSEEAIAQQTQRVDEARVRVPGCRGEYQWLMLQDMPACTSTNVNGS